MHRRAPGGGGPQRDSGVTSNAGPAAVREGPTNALVIYHGDGSSYSMYANCGDIYVRLGDAVAAGQPVATMGSVESEMLFALWSAGSG